MSFLVYHSEQCSPSLNNSISFIKSLINLIKMQHFNSVSLGWGVIVRFPDMFSGDADAVGLQTRHNNYGLQLDVSE